MKDVREQVYKIIANVLDTKIGDIRPDASWEDSNTDSFALVELVVGLQEHFKIQFDSRELSKIKTVDDMVQAVSTKLGE